MANKKIKVALAGNPNSGKTTIFNNLSGARQHIGNYPGVTVEKIEGRVNYKGYEIDIVDLPGTYSLTTQSIDEVIARNFLIEEKPDVVVNIVDSSNLERHLYLSTQLIELGIPLVFAFNMHDEARRHAIEIDSKQLSELLGAPIVFTVATRRAGGTEELLDAVLKVAQEGQKEPKAKVVYSDEIEEEILKLEELFKKEEYLTRLYPLRWLAVKLLEEDKEIVKVITPLTSSQAILEQRTKSVHRLQGIYGDQPDVVIADSHYGFVSGACREAVKRRVETRHSISDKIDKVLVNQFLGLPIFLGVMWLAFKFTFAVSGPMISWIEWAQERLGNFMGELLSFDSVIQSLVVDGIIGGVGSVLVFVPMIFLLFLTLAFLEGTGYMARAVFIVDRFMHRIGLHGRSFVPMLLGFGCSVAGIMATRTIEDRRDRIVTILINPFMSCSARLPVYVLFIGAFFPEHLASNVLFSLYILGIIVAILMAKIFRKYLLRGESSPFVMELPSYRMPTAKGLLIHTWARGAHYLKKAGTIIFMGAVIIWFLSNFPQEPNYSKNYDALMNVASQKPDIVQNLENEKAAEKIEKSYAGSIGKAIEPFFKPLGFGDWRVAVSLIGGVAGKEIVVSTLGTLYAVGETDETSVPLRESLQKARLPNGAKLFTPLSAYAFMVFILLYFPCVAVIATVKKETHSWRWPLFTIFYTVAIAWFASFIIYQGGRFLGIG